MQPVYSNITERVILITQIDFIPVSDVSWGQSRKTDTPKNLQNREFSGKFEHLVGISDHQSVKQENIDLFCSNEKCLYHRVEIFR